jgi:hypothetical protein
MREDIIQGVFQRVGAELFSARDLGSEEIPDERIYLRN